MYIFCVIVHSMHQVMMVDMMQSQILQYHRSFRSFTVFVRKQPSEYTEYGNGAFSYGEQSYLLNYQPFDQIRWHPASYFIPSSNFCTHKIIGVGLCMRNMNYELGRLPRLEALSCMPIQCVLSCLDYIPPLIITSQDLWKFHTGLF